MIMEILSNFSSAYCFISFILGALFMLTMLCIAAMGKVQEPMNNVHFYVVRDNDDKLWLYLGKPYRYVNGFNSCDNGCIIVLEDFFSRFGLNPKDYDNLRYEDEPVEVFLNLED